MSFKPTDEQLDIEDDYLDNFDIIAKAGAGAGKTTTMRLLAEADPRRDILYIAFNKSVADEAKRRMPRNVRPMTAHSLAYGWARDEHPELMRKLSDNRWAREDEFIKLCFPGEYPFVTIPGILKDTTKTIGPGQLSRIAMATMRNYCNSADESIGFKHLKRPESMLKPAWLSLKEQAGPMLVAGAKRAWANVIDPDANTVRFGHEIYLKLYQLSDPDLSRRFDVVILDEAQDANAVIASIVMNQLDYCQLVLVGDEAQAIYCQPVGTMVEVPVQLEAAPELTRCVGPECIKRLDHSDSRLCHVHELQRRAGGEMTALQHQPRNVTTTQVPIEDLQAGDKVVTYNNAHLFTRGRAIESTTRFPYQGRLVRISTEDGMTSAYTPEHHVYVRMGGDSLRNQHAVYLMRKGDSFRVGRAPMSYKSQGGSFGPGLRASQEGADAMWILSTHDTVAQASLAEALTISRYGLPGVRFSPTSTADVLDVQEFWRRFGTNLAHAESCLRDHGRLIDFPLWTKGYQNTVGIRRPVVTAAANLIDGMEVAPLSARRKWSNKRDSVLPGNSWTPAKVTFEDYDGDIVSIQVADHHNYFADGILTHNSFTGAVNAIAKFIQVASSRDIADRDAGKDKPERLKILPLSESFRFGPQIAASANRILGVLNSDMRIVGRGPEGEVIDGPGMEQGPDSLRDIDAVLVRTNAGGIDIALRAVEQGLRPSLAADTSQMTKFIKAALSLQTGKKVTHEVLADFDTWPEFVELVENDESAKSEYGVLVRLIDKYGAKQLIALLERIKDTPAEAADFLITTAHKAKGAEWDTVLIGSDFESASSPDEQMLAYVSITRAKKKLYAGPLWPLTRWGLLPASADEESAEHIDPLLAAYFGFLPDADAAALVGPILDYLAAARTKAHTVGLAAAEAAGKTYEDGWDTKMAGDYVRDVIQRAALRWRLMNRQASAGQFTERLAGRGVHLGGVQEPIKINYRQVLDLDAIPDVFYPAHIEGMAPELTKAPLPQGAEDLVDPAEAAAATSVEDAAQWLIDQATAIAGVELTTAQEFLAKPGERSVIYRIVARRFDESVCSPQQARFYEAIKAVVENASSPV